MPSEVPDKANLVFEHVDEAQLPRALSLLLTGTWAEPGSAVDGFRAYVGQQGLSLDRLWVARTGSRYLAAVLILPNTGRSAMVFISPCRHREQGRAVTQLLRHVMPLCDDLEGYLIQILLEPEQRIERTATLEAGFSHLADLGYLQKSLHHLSTPSELPEGFGVVLAEQVPPESLRRVILASYEQTLDCPALVGKRDIEDIIAGHKATGLYDPTLWFLLQDEREGRAAAAVLINPLLQQGGYELVYLGVDVAYRQRGLGRALLEYAMRQLTNHYTRSTLYLAVDLLNVPALKLYRGLGFRQTTQRSAFLATLESPKKTVFSTGSQPGSAEGVDKKKSEQ